MQIHPQVVLPLLDDHAATRVGYPSSTPCQMEATLASSLTPNGSDKQNRDRTRIACLRQRDGGAANALGLGFGAEGRPGGEIFLCGGGFAQSPEPATKGAELVLVP